MMSAEQLHATRAEQRRLRLAEVEREQAEEEAEALTMTEVRLEIQAQRMLTLLSRNSARFSSDRFSLSRQSSQISTGSAGRTRKPFVFQRRRRAPGQRCPWRTETARARARQSRASFRPIRRSHRPIHTTILQSLLSFLHRRDCTPRDLCPCCCLRGPRRPSPADVAQQQLPPDKRQERRRWPPIPSARSSSLPHQQPTLLRALELASQRC